MCTHKGIDKSFESAKNNNRQHISYTLFNENREILHPRK